MENYLQYRNIHPLKYYRECLAHEIRPDGRTLMRVRPATLNVGSISTAVGSAIVKIGKTTVVCGIKAELAAPKADNPGCGFLVPNVDFPPLCSPMFRPGPPSDVAQAETSLLNTIISSCQLMDLSTLCVSNDKLVWVLYCDMVCLDFSGSIMDALLLSLVAALRTVLLPEVIYDVETSKFTVNNNKKKPLEIKCSPVATTFATFEDNKILADPNAEEEKLSNGRVTIVTDGEQLFTVFKPGGSALSETDLQTCIGFAKERANDMNQMMETALANREP